MVGGVYVVKYCPAVVRMALTVPFLSKRNRCICFVIVGCMCLWTPRYKLSQKNGAMLFRHVYLRAFHGYHCFSV